MAPELALRQLPQGLSGHRITILDPMMGSGTIPVLASQSGHRSLGFDLDPLALVIARAWGRPLDPEEFTGAVGRIQERARATAHHEFDHPDVETQEFINYWFDRQTQRRLHALSTAIVREDVSLRDALWCAFSRLIITKDAGASRARDVSHSRPHRVRDVASFNVVERFATTAYSVLSRHQALGVRRSRDLRLELGDARKLPVRSNSVDVVITSPPYLQAIDYMCGHRLSLVWMGHRMAQLRDIRAESIGTERGSDTIREPLAQYAEGVLSARSRRVLTRYVDDLDAVLRETRRVLRSDGSATFVVADGTLNGTRVRLGRIVHAVAEAHGLNSVHRESRSLPSSRRYLPPPGKTVATDLDRRMRREWLLTFRVAA